MIKFTVKQEKPFGKIVVLVKSIIQELKFSKILGFLGGQFLSAKENLRGLRENLKHKIRSLVKGIHAKRVWQYNGEYEYGDRTRTRNQGGLLMIRQADSSDSGNYTCVALKQGTSERLAEIEYKLNIKSNREHWTPGEPRVSCSKVKDQPVASLNAFKIDNATVGITWRLPDYFNQSCYDHISLLWWTNLSDSSYEEKHLALEKTQVSLAGLEDELTYYVQVNLIAPLNVQVYGHTLTFNLAELDYGTFPTIESDSKNNADSATYSALPSPLVLVILSLVLVFICIILVVCLVKWRQKHSKPDHSFARNSVHIRHPSAVSVCCHNKWCYSGKSETHNEDHMFQKTNFNGFDTGEYEDMVINTTAADRRDSLHALPTVVHVPKPSTTKRTSFLDKTSNNPNDFMSNISSNLPQWPEPEAQWPETEETIGSEFMGITFQAAQLTHERFLTIDHSCKIFFDICQTELPQYVVLYVMYSTTHQRLVKVQFGR